MKRSLLLILMAFIYTVGNAQVVFYVQPPSSLEGNYSNTYADGTDWGVSDLTDPANAVIGDLALALDATDSLVCDSPVVSDVDGKVALLWRGACEFGYKALAAQNAGAIACVIVNHSGEPVGMGGGANGGSVTIPTVMVSTATGAALYDAMMGGETIEVFIGNKNGFYNNDIGMEAPDIVRPQFASHISDLAMDSSEYNLSLGAWVRNYGVNDQTNVTLNGMLDAGSITYDMTSDPVDIVSGDSAYIELPMFDYDGTLEAGVHSFTYTVSSDSVDDFPGDDVFSDTWNISDEMYSFGSIPDEETGPNGVQYFRPSTVTGEIQQCVHFQDANASRVNAVGMTFSFTTNADDISGEVILLYAYEWTLEFEDLLDDEYVIDEGDFDLLSSGVYEYLASEEEGANVYASFEDIVEVEDDVRYLFCISYESDDLFAGYDAAKVDYFTTQDIYLQPMYPNTAGGEWFTNGFGTDITPAIAVHFENASSVSENAQNIEVTPYPNPATDLVTIPLKDVSGLTTINIFDATGRVVKTEQATVTPNQLLEVEVADLEAGVYTFGLLYEDGNVSNFNVVISK